MVQHDTSLSTVGNIMKDEEQPRVDTVFKERRIRPFRKELMDDSVDMKEGHVKESNEVMGVLSSKFEASAGIVGVINPDDAHHHVVERRAADYYCHKHANCGICGCVIIDPRLQTKKCFICKKPICKNHRCRDSGWSGSTMLCSRYFDMSGSGCQEKRSILWFL